MLQTIGNSAFKNCSSLGSLTFPTQYAESDLQIGIFEGCSNLQFVKVPNKFMSFAETTNTGADPAFILFILLCSQIQFLCSQQSPCFLYPL